MLAYLKLSHFLIFTIDKLLNYWWKESITFVTISHPQTLHGTKEINEVLPSFSNNPLSVLLDHNLVKFHFILKYAFNEYVLSTLN